MRVLIIDDSAVMRKIVEGALFYAGLQVDEVLHAANGVEGLAVLEIAGDNGEQLDLILCDVHMPRMDGPSFLLEKVRRGLAVTVPVVMITADTTDPHLLRSIAAGAQSYIAKPFTVKQVRVSLSCLPSIAAGGDW